MTEEKPTPEALKLAGEIREAVFAWIALQVPHGPWPALDARLAPMIDQHTAALRARIDSLETENAELRTMATKHVLCGGCGSQYFILPGESDDKHQCASTRAALKGER